MRDLTETAEESLDPASLRCLERTRSGVLNVLVAVGAIVALTGLLLRGRAAGGPRPAAAARHWIAWMRSQSAFE